MITATNLSKRFKGVHAVRDVSFTCEPGTITGFLGPNGAGKSTTLRMITGLSQPDTGSSTVAGRPYSQLTNAIRTAGVLLDASAVHPGRSGRDTLVIAARLAGVPDSRADEVLRLVGLSPTAAKRRAGAYSLGMRQRLGIAQALIGDPQILILDEPANGLDPEGIAWMRLLLREFADRGGTVLLSSHLLAEVQATVDHLVVISGGAIVASGRLSDLLGGSSLLVRSPNLPALEALLHGEGARFRPFDETSVVVETADGAYDPERLAKAALRDGVLVTELRAADGGLEHLFFSLTGDPTDATTPEAQR